MFKRIVLLISAAFLLNNTGVFAAPSIVGSVTDNRTDYAGSQIPKYEKFEITFTIDSTYSNPYNYDTSTGGVKIDAYFTHQESGVTDTVAVFWFQDYIRSKNAYNYESLTVNGSPCWKARYAPDTTGDFNYSLKLCDSTGEYVLALPVLTDTTFTAVNSSNKGFMRINPKNKRFFSYDNGDDYFGIGLNVRSWTPSSKKTYFFDEFFNTMEQNKANFARVWMVNSVSKYTNWVVTIQEGSGNVGKNYDLADAWRMDQILASAKDNDIFIQLNLEDVNSFTYNWYTASDEKNIYCSTSGGPCALRSDFFTNSAAKSSWKQLLRYIVARYGYSSNILSWELFNEVNELQWSLVAGEENWSTVWSSIKDWHSEMAQEIENLDVNNHIITTCTGSFKTYFDLYGLPELDYNQMHAYYIENSWAYSPPDISKLIAYYSEEMTKNYSGKPNVFGECGVGGTTSGKFYSGLSFDNYGNALPSLTGNFDTSGIHLGNGLWTGVMYGLAATPLTWAWGQHLIYPGWWKHYKSIANYLEGENISDSTFVTIDSWKENLIGNAGFEDDTTGWTKNPPSSTRFSIDTAISHEGTKSLKWESNVSETMGLIHYVNIMPNQEYTLSGWLKTENVVSASYGVRMAVYISDGSGGERIKNITSYYKGTSGWQKFSLTFTAPPFVTTGAYGGEVILNFGSSTGTAWVDDLKLAPSGIYAPPFSNNRNMRMISRKNNTRAFMWIQNKNHTWYNIGVLGNNNITAETASITIPSMNDTTYLIEWWDIYSTTGVAYRKQKQSVSDSTLDLFLPAPLATNIAVKIKPLLKTASSFLLGWTGEVGYTSGGVDPESGYSTANFTFRVQYTDSSGYFPAYVQLLLDKNGDGDYSDNGEVINMDEDDPGDNDVTDGKIYTKTDINIPFIFTAKSKNISYKFSASDGTNSAEKIPATPVKLNKFLSLLDWTGENNYMSGGVYPENGYSANNFTFRVKYYDYDNYPPSFINLLLDKNGDGDFADTGEKISMSGADTGDTNYIDGKIYTKTLTIPYTSKGKNISHKFLSSNGYDTSGGIPANAVNLPDLFINLSVSASSEVINLNQLNLASFSQPNSLTLNNTSDGTVTFNIQITDPLPKESGWSAGSASGEDIYVLKALFTGINDTAPAAGDFKDDDIVTTAVKNATSTVFGDTSSKFSVNGAKVPAGSSVKLWLLFKSPQASSSQNEENISVKIGIVETP